MMIAITGSTGQLGRLVVEKLRDKVPASEVVAIARDPEKAKNVLPDGVEIRQGDYDDPASLERAFAGVEKLLLISSNEVGKRFVQHRQAVEAAQKASVGLLVYTSLLHADRSPLSLAEEHLETEKLILASGLPFVILRNGWYTENYTQSIPAILKHGEIFGSAGDGRVSAATRLDYAEAAVAVLTESGEVGTVYELAGDDAFTMAEYAAELSRQTGKEIPYRDLTEAEYAAVLIQAGLPEPFAALLANSDTGNAQGGLYDDSGDLSKLIGRPTTPLSEAIRAALVS